MVLGQEAIEVALDRFNVIEFYQASPDEFSILHQSKEVLNDDLQFTKENLEQAAYSEHACNSITPSCVCTVF
jgi:hypothetical protein